MAIDRIVVKRDASHAGCDVVNTIGLEPSASSRFEPCRQSGDRIAGLSVFLPCHNEEGHVVTEVTSTAADSLPADELYFLSRRLQRAVYEYLLSLDALPEPPRVYGFDPQTLRARQRAF